jgi:aspartate carbamoyltransferase regulatory subunit
LECKNPKCITNEEAHVGTLFTAVDEETIEVKCDYCERIFKLNELDVIFD